MDARQVSENWEFYFANVNDNLASIFVDVGIHDSKLDADRPWLLWVWVDLNSPREDGLTKPEEFETLCQIEDCLDETLKTAVDGICVGRITTSGRREFYYYSPAFVGFEDAAAQAMLQFPDYKWEADNHHDPEWNQYFNLLYPSPYDWQRINNRHVVERLQEAGDSLEKERIVSHWCFFPDDSSRQKFAAQIQDRGFNVTNIGEVDSAEPDSESGSRPFRIGFERVDKVDWDSINEVTTELFSFADSLGGEYDGWETSVEMEPKAPNSNERPAGD